MNRNLIKSYIDSQPIKVVSSLDLSNNKISYSGIKQGRVIDEITGDEEMSRAFILTRLVNELGYSNIGQNTLDKLLKAPNCPFVLYVGTKIIISL